ncbi:unnamed protein product [Tilletia laevis]|uniref:Uncharacterized protein n=3 Tax=Tilletia TaxID=13289 RepID=A0A8X7STU9_9BASI|nr:hypothetical protein CF336_g6811 [Tilletia laevis]KAE8242060.1 hypothetical protein A4X06_0g7279 [Tilletia controversa]KAE8256360.1 hypothetical protein A4X03_0g5410 [Tilletia caries]KAE8191388.1 hypothetical protein CF335_g6104 [Tilletia laevis]CAD6899417.1 unnamed protein product [Tilletia controversa]
MFPLLSPKKIDPAPPHWSVTLLDLSRNGARGSGRRNERSERRPALPATRIGRGLRFAGTLSFKAARGAWYYWLELLQA